MKTLKSAPNTLDAATVHMLIFVMHLMVKDDRGSFTVSFSSIQIFMKFRVILV